MDYDAINEECFDREQNITVGWSGGWGGEGNEWKGFRFTHPDWEVILRYLVIEEGIERSFKIGDLSKNEIEVTTKYCNATVSFQPYGEPEIIRGVLDYSVLTKDKVSKLLSCLYSHGGCEDVKVNL